MGGWYVGLISKVLHRFIISTSCCKGDRVAARLVFLRHVSAHLVPVHRVCKQTALAVSCRQACGCFEAQGSRHLCAQGSRHFCALVKGKDEGY